MMQTGVLRCHLDTLVPCVLYLLLLAHLCVAAPGQPGAQSQDALFNPFGSAEEERRLLQSHIHSLKDVQAGPELKSWEEAVFYLFHLYDFDRSSLLDGLEIMKLISDYNPHHAPGPQTNVLVESMVDFLLISHDLNHDGRIAPSELLSPSLHHTQDSSSDHAPPQVQEEAAAGGAEQREEVHAGEQQLLQEQPQHDTMIQEEQELIQQAEAMTEEQIPEVIVAEQQQQQHAVPVHQGQPEM